MGHYEDAFWEIYEDVEIKGLKTQFNNQLIKMKTQDKHRHKSTKEMWEYAHNKITSSLNLENNLD